MENNKAMAKTECTSKTLGRWLTRNSEWQYLKNNHFSKHGNQGLSDSNILNITAQTSDKWNRG